MYSNGYNVYKNNSVNYASKEQLLLMLTEGAVRFCKIARQAIVDKKCKKGTWCFSKNTRYIYRING